MSKIDYRSLVDEWFVKSKTNQKSLKPILLDEFKDLLKKHNLYKKFPPDLAVYKFTENRISLVNKDDVVLLGQRGAFYEYYIQKLMNKFNVYFKENSHFIIDLASACPKRKVFEDIGNVVISSHVPNTSELHVMPFTDCYYFYDEFKDIYKSRKQYSETRFKDKINKVVWRGNSYPTLRPQDDMFDDSKYQVIGNHEWCHLRLEVCERYYNSPNFNIGFHKVGNEDWKKPYLKYLKDPIEPLDMSEYKYILDVCGTGATCDATIWKLQSGSVLIWLVDGIFYKHGLPLWSAWYTPLLKPFEHYVPATLDNLDDMFDWCEKNQDLCENIINNARSTITEILLIWKEANAYILKKISEIK